MAFAAQSSPDGDPIHVGLLRRLADEPALVVLLLAGACGAVLALVLLAVRRRVREARARKHLEDYLLGVELALCGRHADARARLERVMAHDADNHGARLLLGGALRALGDPVGAHQEHLRLQRAFGVHSAHNDAELARALLDLGRHADAARVLATAVDPSGLRLRLQAELAGGDVEAALATAECLIGGARDGATAELRRTAARAALLAADVRARAGETARAQALRRTAQTHLHGDDSIEAELLREQASVTDAPEHPLLPAAASGAAAGTAVSVAGVDRVARAAAAAASLPFRCRVCGASSAIDTQPCPACGAVAALEARERHLHRPLPHPAAVADAVEQNEAHVGRLLDGIAREGDAEAAAELVDIRHPAAVPLTLRRALREEAAAAGGGDVFVAPLRAMGGRMLPSLFAAYEALAAEPTDSGRGRRELLADLVGRVVRGLGAEAAPWFTRLLDTDDRALRRIVLDYHVGLGDPAALEAVLERLPPVEVIQRLNATPGDRLRALLRRVPAGGFLAEVLLADPLFRRAEDLLLAAAEADDATVLVDVLARRRGSGELASFATDRLGDARVATAAALLIDRLGARAIDGLIGAFVDLDRPDPLRHAARERLLAAGGSAVAPALLRCFGAAAAPLDDDLCALLQDLGEPALPAMLEAYRRRNLLEKVGGRLVQRYNHPRNVIVKTMARIGGPRAWAALEELRRAESDANLKLRLEQALLHVSRGRALPPPAASDDDGGAAEAHRAG